MKIFAEGLGAVTLEERHTIASGGEGTVFGKDGHAFKLYHQPRSAAEKIRLLMRLKHPGIVAPRGAVTNQKQEFLGYWMRRANGESLPNLCANAWRQANGFGDRESQLTALAMRDIVDYAHGAGALLIDGNEFNWIVEGLRAGQHAPAPAAIDVDAWQIGPFPGTAIMTSIRDWHTAGFTEGSDWFAWAVVTFQLFTGIHPYKGTHPAFGRGQLEQRMRANASVFDPDVRLNAAVRNPSAIPAGLLDWYRAVFMQGIRTRPPAQFGVVTRPTTRTTSPSGQDATISIVKLHAKRPPETDGPPSVALAHDRMVKLGGRWFAVVPDSDRGLVELDANGYVKAQWPVLANATRFFRTGALSYYLGQPYLLAVGDNVSIFPAPFLRQAGRVIDVFTDNARFAMVLAVDPHAGKTYRHTARLNGIEWEQTSVEETDETFLNARGNGLGVVAHIPRDGELLIYSTNSDKTRALTSPLIKGNMLLDSAGSAIVFYDDDGEGYRLQASATT